MDTSLEYIKQCEKAEEIQKLFDTPPLPMGTFWARKSEGDYISEGVTGWGYKRLPEWVILPRQDQLQELLRVDGILRFPQLAMAFSKWLQESNYLGIMPPVSFGGKDFPEATSCPFTSMEQLWLAFVMKEKHGKIWTNSEWVKESSYVAT